MKAIEESVKNLIEVGRKQGYMTYDQMNEILPDEIISPGRIDDIYRKFQPDIRCGRRAEGRIRQHR